MGDLDVKAIALIACIVFTVTFLVSFGCDCLLKFAGRPTISQLVWQDPLLGIPVLFPLFGAFVSLAVHLYYR